MPAVRLMLLLTDLQPGGTPLRVVRWAKWLAQAGFDVAVGALSGRTPLCDDLVNAGIRCVTCDARHRFDLMALGRLARVIARHDPDIVHSFLFHANMAARLLGRLDRDRPIITSTATIEIERRWHCWLEALTARSSTRHVVNSRSVERHVVDDLGFPRERVVCVPNGIDAVTDTCGADSSRHEGVPIIAWLGRMDPIKGLDTWITVFDAVRRVRIVRGVLIGDGPMRVQVREWLLVRGLLAEHSEEPAIGRVSLAGWCDAPHTWLRRASVLLFPSRTEGSPNALIEAAAAGCPIVASDVGGIRGIIGNDGWLHAPDDMDGFIKSVLAVIDNPAESARRAAAAKSAITHTQSKNAVITALTSLYLGVLRNPAAP